MYRHSAMAEKEPDTTDAAKSMAYTNYRQYRFAKFQRMALSRGCAEEFNARIHAGERIRDVLKVLMPDVYAADKSRETANQFRSAVNGLLAQGYEAEDLITYIQLKK